MLKIITNSQMKEVDAYTIQHLPVSSVDLMEQASEAFVDAFVRHIPNEMTSIKIYCGKGNNGGDGLAIARILWYRDYRNIEVYIIDHFRSETNDFKQNLKRLEELPVAVHFISDGKEIPDSGVVIDSVLGSGFIGILKPELENILTSINQKSKFIFSVDCPSGFSADHPEAEFYKGIRASHTISFQRPKLGFFFPESIMATETFEFVSIGLDETYIQSLSSDFLWIEESDILHKLKKRLPFSHKGTYGHLLLIMGSDKTMGAAILSAKAALHTGAGLITICVDAEHFPTINTTLPEVMTSGLEELTSDKYQTIGVGCGLGTSHQAKQKVEWTLQQKVPLIIDADALNIIAQNDWQHKIPENSLITPHIKEFDRLFGSSPDWFSRLNKAKEEAVKRRIIIVLKNQYTFICNSDGCVFINPTGNPSMAQGGMGDVLTGCISSLSAQGYSLLDAAVMGCYIHGKSGDRLSKEDFVTCAGDVARQLSKEIKLLLADRDTGKYEFYRF